MGSARVVYRTDPASSITALAAGALVGGAMIPSYFLAASLLFNEGGTSAPDIHLSMYVFIVSTFVWLFGLAFIAAPIWIVLHRRNLRNARVAILLGSGLCFAIGFAYWSALFGLLQPEGSSQSYDGHAMFVGGRLTLYGWQSSAMAGLVLAIQGAIVGFAVWRWAYRKQVG